MDVHQNGRLTRQRLTLVSIATRLGMSRAAVAYCAVLRAILHEIRRWQAIRIDLAGAIDSGAGGWGCSTA